MHAFLTLLGCLLLAGVLLDAFQTIILPRRPVGRFRITRMFFYFTWRPWVTLARAVRAPRTRDQIFSFYGPLSLLLLFALWAALLTTGYSLVYLGMRCPFSDPTHPVSMLAQWRTCLYVSGSTIFTLGLGDVLPLTHLARALLVLEAGTGLGFIALVIGYVPVLYAAFSERETSVALLDARAGSPPTAAELLVRHHFDGGSGALADLLAEWERWSASMLETHISYPILCYYRSQHDNQSWLAALTAILDACAVVITTVEGPATRQAQLTFAVGRHVLVDLVHVFHQEPTEQHCEKEADSRLNDAEFARLCDRLTEAGYSLCGDLDARKRLSAIRQLYEPSAQALSRYLQLDLPRLVAPPREPGRRKDNWTAVADLRSPGIARNSSISPLSTSDHFDQE